MRSIIEELRALDPSFLVFCYRELKKLGIPPGEKILVLMFVGRYYGHKQELGIIEKRLKP